MIDQSGRVCAGAEDEVRADETGPTRDEKTHGAEPTEPLTGRDSRGDAAGTPRGGHGGPTGPVAVFRMLPHVHISVIGCGYLGAVHAACMAGLGHDVVGLDVDAAKVDRLGRGVAPFHEPGFEEVLTEALASGRLTFTTDPSAITECDLHFIAVGTPQRARQLCRRHDLRLVGRGHRRWSTPRCPTAARPSSSASRRCPWAPRRRSPTGWPAQTSTRSWCGTRSSSARAMPSQDTTAPDRIVYGLPEDRERGEIGRAALDRVYAPILEAGHAATGGQLPHGRARQGRCQLLPRHEDLVHQLDGRAVRRHRRRRRAPRRGDRARRAHRPQVPSRRHRLRRRLPARRTSAPSWPAPASSASTSR